MQLKKKRINLTALQMTSMAMWEGRGGRERMTWVAPEHSILTIYSQSNDNKNCK